MQKIVFCFPYRGVGGVSLLFLRVAEELAAKGEVEAYLVDYADGFMAKHRRKELTHLIEYRDDAEVGLPGDSVVVFQSMTPWSIYPSLRFPSEIRIFFWNCHPFNLVPTLPGLRRPMQASPLMGRMVLTVLLRSYRNKMIRLIRLMLARHSLVFMDAGNVATTERYLGVSIPKPVFLPIPAVTPERRAVAENRNIRPHGLRVAWVGRVVDFKYHILKHALAELDRLQPKLGFPVEVTIVGSGDYGGRLQNDAVALPRLSIRFIEHIPPAGLDDFLRDEVDILLAMGTSALEGAKLGIPTILLDVCYGEVPEGYVFQWLHQRSGYSLGEVVGREHIVPGNHSLAERMDEAVRDYPTVSARALAHFESFHALGTVAKNLRQMAENARCTYGDLARAGLTGRGLIYSTFAILRKGLAKA